jgi:2-polyprenyl-3-methyl-5-hydroxy-6-metoxy-1,4-benzoquinol methylase
MVEPGEYLQESAIRRVMKAVLYPVRIVRWAIRGKKYNTQTGYREDKYWEDRHKKFKGDFRAVASYSEEVDDRYPRQREQFIQILKSHDFKIEGCRVLEFGCGNGFWGGVMLERGVAKYTGIDISPTAIEYCQHSYPKGNFVQHHLGSEHLSLNETFNLVCSIDVTQHVVEKPKLVQFLSDMKTHADPGSLIFCTSYIVEQAQSGVRAQAKNVNFVVGWSMEDLKEGFAGCELVNTHEFWDKTLLVFRKPQIACNP